MFDNIKFAKSDIPVEDILFNEAFISIGINDLRGIECYVAPVFYCLSHQIKDFKIKIFEIFFRLL